LCCERVHNCCYIQGNNKGNDKHHTKVKTANTKESNRKITWEAQAFSFVFSCIFLVASFCPPIPLHPTKRNEAAKKAIKKERTRKDKEREKKKKKARKHLAFILTLTLLLL